MAAEYLVTGGAGFIGSNCVHALLDKGASVRVFDNFDTGREVNLEDIKDRIEIVRGDLRDRDQVRDAVKGVRHIIHYGAMPSVVRSVEDPVTQNDVNVTGLLNTLIEARDAGVDRLVFSSSSSVYGDSEELPKHEGMKLAPMSPYAVAKFVGEHYCRIFYELYGFKTYILRYFNVFGPRQNPASHYAAVVPLFIKAFQNRNQPTIYGDGGQTRDFTFVQNVVEANLACCAAPDESAGMPMNIACGDRISVNQLAKTVADICEVECDPIYEPSRPGDVRDSQAANTLAEELIGWTPSVRFEEGLQRTIDWYVQNR